MFGHVRKTRSDCTVGTYEKKHDFPTGTIRNPDGRKARKDKTLGSLRKDSGKEYREGLVARRFAAGAYCQRVREDPVAMDTTNRSTHPKGPVGKEPCASMPAGLLDAAKGTS